jgi:acid phosphatase class B
MSPRESPRIFVGRGFSHDARAEKSTGLQSLSKNSRIFVGRGFNRDVKAAKSSRLQPLKFLRCSSRRGSA